MEITDVSVTDAGQVAEIYRHSVEGSTISFEESTPDGTEMAKRIDSPGRRHWIVARDGDLVLGYAYATEFRARAAYRFTAESTIYVAPDQQRRGIARALVTELHRRLADEGVHTVVSVIALPNPASVALAEDLGYEYVGTLPEVGFKLDQWIDVGLWVVRLRTHFDSREGP